MTASFASGNDPELHQAYARARETVRFFFRELSWERRRIIPGLDLAAIKAPFADGDVPPDDESIEHMWMNDVVFDGHLVHGTLLNAPLALTSVSAGDRASVPLTKISDWMYARKGRVYGAFTVNVLRARMSGAERKQHDGMWGLDFGDPAEIELVPRDWLVPKRSFTDRLLGRGQQAAPDPNGVEHPMAVNMEEKTREGLAARPEYVHTADEDGLTFLHLQAVAGDLRGARAALDHGADPHAKTQLGMTPADIARLLGWSEVVALLEQHEARGRSS